MTQDRLLELLRQLLPAHSPGGEEGEVTRLLTPYFEKYCRDVRQDSAENLIGTIAGRGERPPMIVAAHKDEVGMIVKRVEADGLLRVEALGGVPPWKYGEGAVDLLTPTGTLPGVMSVGSLHTTAESPRVEAARENPLDWPMVRVFTGQSREKLERQGVYAGTRLCVARHRKGPLLMGDYVCGIGLDDKAALAVMLETMRALHEGERPAGDVHFVATSTEEQMGCGGTVVAHRLCVETMLALEIGPVAPEYGLELDGRPIIWYSDSTLTYTKSFCDELAALCTRLGFGCQRAVYGHAGSDASCARAAGQVGRVACLAFPGTNTHGFEIAPVQGLLNLYATLLAYLRGAEAGGQG